jgi:hypothetical protein
MRLRPDRVWPAQSGLVIGSAHTLPNATLIDGAPEKRSCLFIGPAASPKRTGPLSERRESVRLSARHRGDVKAHRASFDLVLGELINYVAGRRGTCLRRVKENPHYPLCNASNAGK